MSLAALGLTDCKKEKIDVPSVKILEEAFTLNTVKAKISAEVTDQGGAVVEKRGFVFGLSGGRLDSIFCGSGVGTYSAELNNLQPNTTYVYEAFAKNEGGFGTSGKIAFTTQDIEILMVETGEVENVTTTTASCSGNVTNDGGSDVTERGICWSTNHNPTINDNRESNGTGTGWFSVDMTDLIPNTSYYVKAYAINDNGIVYGQEVNFKTSQIASYTINVMANPAIGGAVSGGGTYQIGQLCTVIATEAEGYLFSKWTEDGIQISANANYTFTVNNNRTLVANFEVLPQAIEGRFSVSTDQQVMFSHGNLQYNAHTRTWRFAINQYDYIGETNSNISSSYDGWIDLFGWGTGNNPTNFSVNNSDYPEFVDWGVNSISNGGGVPNRWRTLTREEWDYVINRRTTSSNIRFVMARVNNVNGIILLPDDWNSNYYTLNNTNDYESAYNDNVISYSTWIVSFEANGAVFLPAAGKRNGTSVSGINVSGNYWSAYSSNDNYAYLMYFISGNGISVGWFYRCQGYSVRLVCQAD